MSSTPTLRPALWGLIWTALLLPASVGAQTQPADLPADASDVTVELNTQGRGLYQLALPEPEGVGTLRSTDRAGAESLDATLRMDLELSRVFEIQGPEQLSILALTGDRARDFEQYRSLGNELVILGKVRAEDAKLVYEGRLYDLTAGQAILGKRYRGSADAMRRIAHIFADEVIAYLAGRRGIAQTTIAFTSDRTGRKEIFLTDYDGYNQRQLTGHKSTSMSPDWAPGNGSLVYTSFVGGNPGIYRADIATGEKTPAITEGLQNISASFSPDGRKLAFSRALGANSEIFVADTSGRSLRQLTHSRAIDTNPAWSPKGTEIAFTSSRAGNPNVYLMDVEGTNVRRISRDGNYSDGAAWSPSGDKLAFASRIRGRFEIVVTDVVTRESRVLTRGGGNNEQPTFSPDGQWIAFTSNRSGSKQIWVMNAESGGDMRQLTRDGNNESPAWSGYPSRK
ncbi:MAG: Tol-Pal system beta propeller repeat protein TolB [Acidobacteriota bacterium]